MIIDVHSHCHQPEHWGHEHEDHWQGAYGGEPYPGDAGVLRPVMREAGVDVAVVFGLAASQAGVRTPNSFVADFVSRMQTPAIPFCAIDPLDADWREQLEEAIELGFQGVKLYPVLSLFDPLAPEFDDFYTRLTSHGMVALWHMGATPSPVGRLTVSQPLVIDEVARRHPDLTQVMAHMGHPWQRDTNVVLRKNRRVPRRRLRRPSGRWTPSSRSSARRSGAPSTSSPSAPTTRCGPRAGHREPPRDRPLPGREPAVRDRRDNRADHPLRCADHAPPHRPPPLRLPPLTPHRC